MWLKETQIGSMSKSWGPDRACASEELGWAIEGAKGAGGAAGDGDWRSWQGPGHARPGQPHQ